MEMEKFQETGEHPELEAARQRAANAVPPLPEKSTLRPYVFFDFHVNKNPAGRIVIELFDDIAPVAVSHFRNRCSEGASDTFKGTAIYKVLREQAIFGGKSNRYRGGVHMRQYPQLRHCQRGAVSVSLTGDEYLIALTRCLHRDDTHQVVGRVSSGDDVLERLNMLSTDSDDAPYQRVTIARSGFTNAAGTFEDFDEAGAGRKKESAEEAAQRLKQEASQARAALQDALQAGLGQKRKAGAPAARGSGSGAKRSMMDAMLGGLSEGDSEDDEDDADDGGDEGDDDSGAAAGEGGSQEEREVEDRAAGGGEQGAQQQQQVEGQGGESCEGQRQQPEVMQQQQQQEEEE
ncbi:hypothetical protein N2152v2_003105 [Parachlorella kessleri]